MPCIITDATIFYRSHRREGAFPDCRQRLNVRRGTGLLPVSLCQAVGHGQDPAFAGGYGGQVAQATCATVNRKMRPPSERVDEQS
jgi:hypothetical protein